MRLKREGKVRFLGVTERLEGRSPPAAAIQDAGGHRPRRPRAGDPDHQTLLSALSDDFWDVVMLKYGILNQSAAREVLPLASHQNVGVIDMSSIRQRLTTEEELKGLLSDWAERGLIDSEVLDNGHPLAFLITPQVPSIIAAGYKFAVAHEGISTVLIGTGNVEHLEQNVEAMLGPPLPASSLARLQTSFGHLAEGV